MEPERLPKAILNYKPFDGDEVMNKLKDIMMKMMTTTMITMILKMKELHL
jgi:hypothetical protein